MIFAFSFYTSVNLLYYLLLASPLSCSLNFFNRTISASFFNNSRSNCAILYSSCSVGVSALRRIYFAKEFPGLRLFTSASSPPSKYFFLHTRIIDSHIPVSLARWLVISPVRFLLTIASFSSLLWLLFVPPLGLPIFLLLFINLNQYIIKNDGRHFFVSTIIISLQTPPAFTS